MVHYCWAKNGVWLFYLKTMMGLITMVDPKENEGEGRLKGEDGRGITMEEASDVLYSYPCLLTNLTTNGLVKKVHPTHHLV
jgi:hypothetical protein